MSNKLIVNNSKANIPHSNIPRTFPSNTLGNGRNFQAYGKVRPIRNNNNNNEKVIKVKWK